MCFLSTYAESWWPITPSRLICNSMLPLLCQGRPRLALPRLVLLVLHRTQWPLHTTMLLTHCELIGTEWNKRADQTVSLRTIREVQCGRATFHCIPYWKCDSLSLYNVKIKCVSGIIIYLDFLKEIQEIKVFFKGRQYEADCSIHIKKKWHLILEMF